MKALFLFISLALFTNCSQNKPDVQNATSQQTANKEVKAKSDENVAFVKKFFLHFNNHEWDKVESLYATSTEIKNPSIGTEMVKQTKEEVLAGYKELHGIFPDIHDEVVGVYPSGDKIVVVEFVSTGTAPDGSKFKLPICTVFTIENNLITKDYTYYDNSQ